LGTRLDLAQKYGLVASPVQTQFDPTDTREKSSNPQPL
jgi:hypothetical protein